MADTQLVKIEWGQLTGIRPREAGCNARLGIHGVTIKESLARITLADGSSGFGYSRVNREQAEALIGEPLEALISSEGGVIAQAVSLDFPLWDLMGQRAGKPVYALLTDAPGTITVPCYDTSLYFDDLHLEDHAAAAALIADEARQGHAAGHRAFKIKVGRGALHMPVEVGTQRDIAIIRAVREAVGPEAPVMIDANNGYNVGLTKQVLSETADYNLHWIEEPFYEDRMLLIHLREWMAAEGLQVLLADGEPREHVDFMQWVEEGLIDVVQYDLRDIGFSAWVTLARQLDAWGVQSAPHNYGSAYGAYATAHLAPFIKNFTFVEWDTITVAGMGTPGYSIVEGQLHVPASPGFGLELDDATFSAAVEDGGFVVTA